MSDINTGEEVDRDLYKDQENENMQSSQRNSQECIYDEEMDSCIFSMTQQSQKSSHNIKKHKLYSKYSKQNTFDELCSQFNKKVVLKDNKAKIPSHVVLKKLSSININHDRQQRQRRRAQMARNQSIQYQYNPYEGGEPEFQLQNQ